MQVETQVGSEKLQDMGATAVNTAYMPKALAAMISPYKKERYYVKRVKGESLPIYDVA